jgi:hypothetical protein
VELVGDPGPAGADAHLETSVGEHDSECASHAVIHAGRTGDAYTQVPTQAGDLPRRPG